MDVFVGSYGTELLHVDGQGTGLGWLSIEKNQVVVKCLKTWKDDDNVPKNSSYLALHPRLDVLYAINEDLEHGHVFAFKFDKKSCSMEFLSKTSSKGFSCAHVAVDRQGMLLFVVNYGGGPLCVYRLHQETGGIEENVCTLEKPFLGAFLLPGPNIARQEMAHPHQCYVYEVNEETNNNKKKVLYVPDLGLDLVHCFDVRDTGVLDHYRVLQLDRGHGPRHMIIHPYQPHIMFVLCELTSVVLVVDLTKNHETGPSPLKRRRVEKAKNYAQIISTLNGESKGTSDSISTSAAIELHPNGKFLYCSNRTTTTSKGERDGYGSIALFHWNLEEETLNFIKCFNSLGCCPREMKLSPDGSTLFVCNQDSDSIVSFQVDPEDGNLENVLFTHEWKTPVALAFL